MVQIALGRGENVVLMRPCAVRALRDCCAIGLRVAPCEDSATAGAVAGAQSEGVPDKNSTAISTDRKTHRTVTRHARNRSSLRTRRLVGPAQRSFWFADW